jgi:hypothetical protein
MRTCIIHIGTHKTATTTLQIAMARNRALFAERGVYLPIAGRPERYPWGNFQLSWDLLNDGTSKELPVLTAELTASPVDAALITSEDFDRLHARPEAVEALIRSIRAAGYTPKVIVYFRPQSSYAESIYVEMVKHGYVRPLRKFVEQSVRDGMYRQAGSHIINDFRYTRMLDPWVRLCGQESVIVRPFQPQGSEWIFHDFLAVLAFLVPAFGQAPIQLSLTNPRENERLSYGELLDTAYEKLLPLKPPALEPRQLLAANIPDFPPQLLEQRYALLSREETLAFLAALGPDNAIIERTFGARIPFQNEADIASIDDPSWSKAALDRTLFDRLLELWMNAAAAT